MAQIPPTSVSLIRTLANNPLSARWNEVYQRYTDPMLGFIHARYPSLNSSADDLIQMTVLALMKALPTYHYTPDSNHHFHNYLMGILKHKAEDELARWRRNEELTVGLRNQPEPPTRSQQEVADFQREAVEVAIDQLLTDETINPLHRTVFRHVALMHESPQKVATAFGIERANVDQIKKRMTNRLSMLVKPLMETR